MSKSLAIVINRYPRISETFIAQECLGLEQLGFQLHIFALNPPEDGHFQPIHGEISAPITYLPSKSKRRAPAAHVRKMLRSLPGYSAAETAYERDYARDRSASRRTAFKQACVLAAVLPRHVDRIHVHFLASPISVGRYAALMHDTPYSISAHARVLWTANEWEIKENLAAAEWAVCCSKDGAARLASLSDDPAKISLAYHGLDLKRFPRHAIRRPKRDGRDPHDPVTILSVGRAVEKKGYADLLAALSSLPEHLHWRLVHIGDGVKADELKDLAGSLGLSEKIQWLGRQSQVVVLEQMRQADLFALACCIASDGDRDGLPNALMEAMSQGLPIVATDVAGIPELIAHNVDGRLVPQQNPVELARELVEMITRPEERARIGAAGEARIRESFSLDSCLETIVGKLLSLSTVSILSAGANHRAAAL